MDTQPPAGDAPFAEGNEAMTPPEIWANRPEGSPPDSPGWTIRVIPNKFPALSPEPGPDAIPPGPGESHPGTGLHEVIVEDPRPGRRLSAFSIREMTAALEVWRDRLRAAYREPGIAYAQLFRNDGARAGASIRHPHTQLLALPRAPDRLGEEMARSARHRERTGVDLYTHTIEAEIEDGSRVISKNERFVALAPFASRFPHEVTIWPLEPRADFGEASGELLEALAGVLIPVAGALDRALGDPPFNLMVISAPPAQREAAEAAGFRWRVEILPRTNHVAGFEWATGWFVNSTAPEEAARVLRSAMSRG